MNRNNDTRSELTVVEENNTGTLRSEPILVCISTHRCHSIHPLKQIKLKTKQTRKKKTRKEEKRREYLKSKRGMSLLYLESFWTKGMTKPPRQESTWRPMLWERAMAARPSMSSIIPWGKLHADPTNFKKERHLE